MVWPSASDTIAFFQSERWPSRPLKRLFLPRDVERVDGLDLDVEQRLDRRLDPGLVASARTWNVTWLCSSRPSPSR